MIDSTLTATWDAAIAQAREQFQSLLNGKSPATPKVTPPPPGAEAVAAMSDAEMGKFVDHTVLKPETTWKAVEKLCHEAIDHGFASVCVNADYVARCASLIGSAPVGVATVIGFPLGATTTDTKAFEARQSIKLGATELDMVVNIGRLKDKDYAFVLEDIRAVVEAGGGAPVKVILETGGLSLEEKIAGCLLSKAAGAAFVKTSTGFLFGGATVEDVALMRRVVGPELGVKASGGIRDAASARAMLAAGANRLGTSAALTIIGHTASAGAGY